MKLSELRQLIKEEIQNTLSEAVTGDIKVGESYYFGDLKGAFTGVTIMKVTPEHIHYEYDMDGGRGKMLVDNFKKKATKNPSRRK